MNRAIKLRVWDKEKSRWLFGYEDVLAPIGRISDWAEGKYFHITQFTGLHDKNGKEIYEGDIVSALFRGGTPTVFAVEYEEHHGEWQDQYFVGFDFGDIQSKSVEVIGNIYENPDLLK